MNQILSRRGTNWSEDEIVLALAFYCNQPEKNRNGHGRSEPLNLLAEALGRSQGSIARKLANIQDCDPSMRAAGRPGLPNGSSLDLKTWQTFSADWSKLPEAVLDAIVHCIPVERQDAVFDILLGGEACAATSAVEDAKSERVRESAASFFRRSVLAAYGFRCCVTGMDERGLLKATPIRAGRTDNPSLGICFNALFGKAFERGLVTVDAQKLRFVVSPKIRRTDEWYRRTFAPYENIPIILPASFRPDREALEYHNEKVFVA